MSSTTTRFSLLMAAVCLLAPVWTLAQSPAPRTPPQVFKAGVDLVTVDLTVIDSKGLPIAGLDASTISVLVDGSPRRVVSVAGPSGWTPADGHASATAGEPRTIVLLVDPSSMNRGDGMQALHAAARFIDRVPAGDRLSVAVLPALEPAMQFDELRSVLKDRVLRGAGSGIANDLYTPRQVQLVNNLFDRLSAIEGPKQVILIVGTGVGPDRRQSLSEFTDFDALANVATAWQSRVVLHQLTVSVQPGWEGMSADRRTASVPMWTRDSTRSSAGGIVATATGGLAMAPVSGDTFFQRFEREESGGYVLAFEPIEADRDGRAHVISVKVASRPGSSVRARHEFALDRQVASIH